MAGFLEGELDVPKNSIYTKETGWKLMLSKAKDYALQRIQDDVNANHYQGSVWVGNNYAQYEGYQRIINISGVIGINDFWVGKKVPTVFDTVALNRRWYVSEWQLADNLYDLLGNKGVNLGPLGNYPNLYSSIRYNLESKSVCDEIVNSYVKDKPDFYIRMLDQMRSRGSSITRETKRNMMAILELAIEMGANGTTALLTAKEINPNTIPTTTGGTGTGTTGTGTGSAGSESSTGANVALIGLGLFAVGLLLSNTEKPKNN